MYLLMHDINGDGEGRESVVSKKVGSPILRSRIEKINRDHMKLNEKLQIEEEEERRH